MAPAAVEVDLGVGAGAAAGELEAGWREGERSTAVRPCALKPVLKHLGQHYAEAAAVKSSHLAAASSPRRWSW